MAQQYGTGGDLTVTMAGPFAGAGGGAGVSAKLTGITLPADGWKGAGSPYSQVVGVEGVSLSSMVNLQPSVEQLQLFHDLDLAFTTVNEDGIVTVYAIGEKPGADYTIQATILEVIM